MPEPEPDLVSETHLVFNPSRDRGRAVLVSPTSYHVGMSSLAVHTLYALLNAGGLACERAFLPGGKAGDGPGAAGPACLTAQAPTARRGAAGPARSLESGTPLSAFEFVLVTSSFELDWLSLPAMLQAGGIPPLREDREPHHPLVIAGGPAVTMNPEPLAEMLDAAVIGEIEPIAAEFLAALTESDSHEEVLARLGHLPGVYLPGAQERCEASRLVAPDLSGFSTESVILTPNTEFGDRFLIEVGRGCGRGCRFCLARQIYHPNRVRRPAMLLERIDRALEHTRRIGLVGAAISDYPWGDELFGALLERGAQVSVSSVRAESVSEALLALLAASGQDALTLAPEAGSEDLRRAIGKEMTDDDLFRCVGRGLAAGISRYKLYFMIGLPGETEADVAAIPVLITRLREACPGAVFSASVSPFVPKPHTPFAQATMLPQAELTRRLKRIEQELRRQGVYEVALDSARWASVQALLSAGGRELTRGLVEASLAGGSYSDLRTALRSVDR